MNIYVLLDDKQRGGGAKTYYALDEPLFRKLNTEGYGVYFAVNEFNVTDEQMTKAGCATKRHDSLCTRLRYAYADLDIAKKGDGQTREQKEEKKKTVMMALLDKCIPTMIIDTSNGVQPLWQLKDTPVTEETKQRYKKVIKGIVEWSKSVGCKADSVFDTARILRKPGYYHQKEEPYLCDFVHRSDVKYSLEELEKIFPFQEEVKEKPVQNTQTFDDPVSRAISEIDICELVTKAFASIGRMADWNKNDELILDGRKTGTFRGRKDSRQYIASSSHEPFRGNLITVVADILQITNKDARKWIIDTYNLDYSKLAHKNIVQKQIQEIEKQKFVVKKDYRKRYTWGTKQMDDKFAIIKRNTLLVVGATRSSGKTTYTFDMAIKNANLGHNILYLSLEMDKQDILNNFARKYSGITIPEERDYCIPRHKQEAFDRKLKELDEIKTLHFEGIRKGQQVIWETLIEIINKYQDIDMIIIDNLDLIGGEPKEDDNTRQKRLINNMMSFTSERYIPIVLIHHYRKSQNQKKRGMDELSGSGKIADGADYIINISRNSEPDAPFPSNCESIIHLQKARGYQEAVHSIYFIEGTFQDSIPLEQIVNNIKYK